MNALARSEDGLLQLVLHHHGTVTGLVTPECAGWLLKLNTGNRPLLEAEVRKFEAILARGEWINTGEPVIVSKDGTLNDGQHRLEAIFRSGRAAEMDVRFGIPREAFTSTGTGRVRTPSDVLAIAGESNTKRIVSILRLVDGYRRGALLRSYDLKLTAPQYMELLDRHPFARDAGRIIGSLRGAPGVTSAPFGALLVLGAEETDAMTAIRFAELVDNGTSDRGDGARELRERMILDARNRSTMPQPDRLVLCIKAWNAWIEGREVRQLKVTETDRTPQYFPRVAGRVKHRLKAAAA